MAESPTYALWSRLAAKPGGKRLFSAAMCLRVPYFRTVVPAVRDLRPGRCEVTAPKWWGGELSAQMCNNVLFCDKMTL
jgi:hypothetical protein